VLLDESGGTPVSHSSDAAGDAALRDEGWADLAVQARAVLVEQYWQPRRALFAPHPRERGLGRWRGRSSGPWHYWWQAHALEVLLDALDPSGPPRGALPSTATDDAVTAARLVPALVAGVTAASGGDITANDFVDDLAWMGLATWRAAGAGLVPASVPLALAEAVLAGHEERHGGFRWRRGSAYRNVAAGAPAALLLARTAAATGEPSRLETARRTARWLHEHLVDLDGVVADGSTHRGGTEVVNRAVWSYNLGAVVALDVELARHASDAAQAQAGLARAARTLRAGATALRAGPTPGTSAAGRTWRDEAGAGSTEEAALFRGILARFAADLVLADPVGTRDVAADLAVQAHAAARARDTVGRIGAGWVHPHPGSPSLAAHLAGAATLAAAARAQQALTAARPS
jgi:predicted alpha-1,6-mannanase (GH76 family)